MALDRWLLEQHQQHQHPPTLRFYTWHPTAISLGYHQRQIPAHWQNLTWNDRPLEIVRRPSGGRAVLHQGDLTYAVITSGIAGTRMQAYQTICEFLIRGWKAIGVELHYGTAGRGYIHNPNCFGTATAADLVLPNGGKLIGSAQLRRGNAILQHGSMRLQPDPVLFEQVFGEPMEAIDLPFSLNESDLQQKVMNALIIAACNTFDIQFVTQPLTDLEWEAIGLIDELLEGV
jgi:lipoate-protein ligase A